MPNAVESAVTGVASALATSDVKLVLQDVQVAMQLFSKYLQMRIDRETNEKTLADDNAHVSTEAK